MRLYRVGMYISLALSILCQGILVGQLPSPNKAVTTRAVIVGISEYQDTSIGNLRFAHRDAKAFAVYLQSEVGGGLGEDQFRLLTNENATLGQISAALEWLQETSQSGDQAIIYFSGHGDAVKGGSREGYLLCYDAVVGRYTNTGALSLNALQNVISTLSIDKEAQVLFLADACRSGGLENRMGVGGFGKDLAVQYSHELKLLSCQPHELSHEGEQWGGGSGVFSHYLIEGLMGFADEDGNEIITLMELELYVKRKVSLDMRPVSQVPIARGEQTKAVAFVSSQLLANLMQKKGGGLEEPFKPADPRTNILHNIFANTDSTAHEYYLSFIQAIKRKDFLFPEEDCAEKWFALLMDNPDISAIHSELRRTYAAALQDDAQQVLIKYIQSDPGELTKSSSLRISEYAHYPEYFDRAISLLSTGDHRLKALQSRKFLFEGIQSAYLSKSSNDSLSISNTFNNFHRALEIDPDNVVAMYYLMSWHSMKTMNYDSAKYYYNRSTEIVPDWVVMHSYWGYYLANYLNKIDEGEQILRYSHKLDSSNIVTHQALGALLVAKKEYEEAIVYFNRLTELEKMSYLPWLNLGICELLSKDYINAIIHFDISIDLDSNIFSSHLNSGIAHFNLNNYEEAEQAYLRANTLNPTNKRLKSRMASLYLEMEEFEKVNSLCAELESISPNDYNHWYIRACLAAKQDQLDDAFLYLSKALSIKPDIIEHIGCKPLLDLIKTNPKFMALSE